MTIVQSLFNGVYKLMNVHFDFFGHSVTFLQIAIFTFLLDVAVWIVGGMLK